MRTALLLLAVLAAGCSATRLGTAAITRPLRVPVVGAPSEPHEDVTITTADGLTLEGWRFLPEGPPRGLVVFVHGKDINRQHFISAVGRFRTRGLLVLAYDQRAHGRSQGDTITYGAKEVGDLQRAIDVGLGRFTGLPVFLIGESLGAAVSLQTAAVEPRVAGVVAGASFQDMRTIITEKTPFFLPEATRDDALALAEQEGGFTVDDVSPLKAAPRITAPVLLLHGTQDTFIPTRHSVRILEALTGPKRLVRLEGVGHVDILLHEEAWQEIEAFLFPLVPAP